MLEVTGSSGSFVVVVYLRYEVVTGTKEDAERSDYICTLYCISVLTNLNTVALSIISSIVLQKAQNDNIVHLVPRNIIVAEAVTSSSAFLAKAAFASVVLVQLADS
jgi:hypothetical protein